MVGSAAIAHIIVGDFELGLTTAILIGALPAVYLGARLSSKAPDGVIRPALVFVLLASALKLLNVPTLALGIALAAVALVGLPLWAAVDAASFPGDTWSGLDLVRDQWIRRLLLTAPVGVGFGVALRYFSRLRPQLAGASVPGRGMPPPGVSPAATIDGA